MDNIALIGPHRTGKTTLAHSFIEKYPKYAYLPLGASHIFKRHNVDPSQYLDFDERLRIQYEILTAAYETLSKHKHDLFISDRSPIDFAAYLLSDITAKSPDYFKAVRQYCNDCFELHNQFFPLTFLLQPSIPFVHEPLKGAPSESYRYMLNELYKGLLTNVDNQPSIIPKHTTSIQARVDLVGFVSGVM